MLGKRLAELRKSKGLSQYELANRLGFSRGKLANYEQGSREPDYETLKHIADYFEVSVDYLLGRTEKHNYNDTLPNLTEKDEKDIAKDLEDIINNLSTDGYAHFDGRSIDELDEEDKELLLASLENSMRLAKRLAKKKFTPKKYRK
ncbi:MAG TPA: helix-turn-helix domain-containing protein [Cerasibacillus sp.]|uniref:helix-turn-helix domain-containing protein n=1 Tax=Cerasibacillus sp. TaxID=2498711 RepID=UPI002F400683